MKTVLAQGRKDLVSHAILLWVWIVCVGVDCLSFFDRTSFHHSLVNGSNFTVFSGTMLGGIPLAFAAFATQALLAIILLVRIVQADLLTDSSAFWRTRPIARHELLVEKALFAAVLIIGCFLAGWAIPLYSPVQTGGRVARGMLVFVSGLFAFAAVTSDLSKFIIVFLALAWGAQIVAAILLAAVRYSAVSVGIAATSWPLAARPLFGGENGHLVISAFYFLAFVAIAVLQYLTLRTKLARALLFATFLVATFLQGGSGVKIHTRSTVEVRRP